MNDVKKIESSHDLPKFEKADVGEKILKKIFGFDITVALVMLLFIVSIVPHIIEYSRLERDKGGEVLGQILITSYYSEWSTFHHKKALPINLVKYMDNLNLASQLKALENMRNLEEFGYRGIADVSEFNENEHYKIYPVEYNDYDNKNVIFVLDYYSLKHYSESLSDSKIDTCGFFEIPDLNDKNSNVKLDMDKYRECIREISSDDNYVMSAAYVVFEDGYTIKDFLDDNKDLSEKEYLVYSKEVYDYLVQLGIIYDLRIGLKSIAITTLPILIALVLILILRMLVIKNKIIALKNYNIYKEAVVEIARRKMNNRAFLLLFAFAIMCFNIYLMRAKEFMQTDYIYVLVYIIVNSIGYVLGAKTIKIIINKYYRWNER